MKRFALLGWLLILSGALAAQTLHIEEYFLLKKNESIQVNTIFQDKTGFVWFGTNKGLFKFNGKTYQRFTTADSLQDNQVTAIAQDSLGRIWIGHENGALSFSEKDHFQKFTVAEGSASAAVSSILFDKRGVLWFSTLNDGLYFYFKERLYRVDEDEGMPDIFVYDIVEDQDGNIWAGTDGGLAKCVRNDVKVNIKVYNTTKGLPDNIVKKLAFANNTIWLATEDQGVVKFDMASQRFFTIESPWTHGSVTDFVVGNEKLWIGSAREGLLAIDLKVHRDRTYNFNHGSIACMLKDQEGNIWMGSKTGVIRTPGDQLKFTEQLLPSRDNDVLAITSGTDGTIWFSTKDGLFAKHDGDASSAKMLSNTPYEKFTVISLYEDNAGYIWAGLYGQGVLRINSRDKTIRYYSKELRNGNVLSITGKGDTIWLATLGGAEQVTLDGNNVSFKNFNSENGLSSDFIYQVFVDSQSRVWFATDGRGVDMKDSSGFHHLEEGLPSKVVYGFAEDNNKNVWVNVQGNGIFRITGNIFSANQAPFQLRDNNVNCLSSDQFGNLVVMHDLGIDVLDFENGRVRFYDQQSGIENYIATLNCVSRDRDGKLLFGTDGGIIHYQTDHELLSHLPTVTIAGVKIFNSKIDWKDRPVLSYDEDNVTISYYGIWYQDIPGVQFQYMLENFDPDWILTGDNSVPFSRLPPGKYKFLVRASANQNFDQSIPASFSFEIRPPFWRTSLFYAVMLIAVASTIYALIKIRERRLLRDKKILEMKVVQRTREIQRQKEEIQAQNEEIMAQAEEIKGINENLEMLVQQRTQELERKNHALEEYAFINAHKLRSPLASILGLTNLLSKQQLQPDAKEINEHLQQRASELDSIVRTITKAIEKGVK
jgi:ligand-binding sensor domain-containing protein